MAKDRPRWRHDGVTAQAVDDYLYSMLPKRDEVLEEMETYASKHNVPIVGPAVARVLQQFAIMINQFITGFVFDAMLSRSGIMEL